MSDDLEVHVHLHVDTDGDEQRDEQQASIEAEADVPSAEEGMNAGAASLSAHDLEEGADSSLERGLPADATTAQNAGRAPDDVERSIERGRSRSPDSGSEIRIEDLSR